MNLLKLSVATSVLAGGQLLVLADNEDDTAECSDVHTYNSSWQCHFVNSTKDCYSDEGYIQYIIFIYCSLQHNLLPLAVTILIFWLLFLFIALAIAADNFFCPSLEVIAKVLRMSDNIAGVTLLAFGNGAPDVFSAISAVANMKNGDVGMVFGALLGAGVFLTTVVAGAVTLVGSFHAMERPFLRDIIFYIGTIFFTFYLCHNGSITFAEAISYIGAYVVYVLVVIGGRLIYRYMQRMRNLPGPIITEVQESDDDPEGDETLGTRGSIGSSNGHLRHNGGINERSPLLGPGDDTRDVDLRDGVSDQEEEEEVGVVVDESASVWVEFLHAISPIDIAEWNNREDKFHLARIYAVFKAPGLFLLKLTVPLVDYGKRPKHNWSKPLNVSHCIITPVFCVFAASSSFALKKLGPHFPMFVIFLIAGVVLAIVVFFTSHRARPPVYHSAFAFFGFISGIMWIKNIANEIVNILQAAGVVFSISNTVLGLTFLAWGNSISDLISDVSMARRGRPRTGLSACFGGPLFNTLLGIGIPFTYATYQHKSFISIKFTAIQLFLFIGLAFSLISSLVVVPLMRFRLKRMYGIYLIVLYIIFLTLALLIERDVIQWKV